MVQHIFSVVRSRKVNFKNPFLRILRFCIYAFSFFHGKRVEKKSEVPVAWGSFNDGTGEHSAELLKGNAHGTPYENRKAFVLHVQFPVKILHC